MPNESNVFISWSGTPSKHVAKALKDWLPLVIQAAVPWMSDSDIDKGARGLSEISQALQGKKVGIVCLTSDNLTAPWILYEAGALSKTIDDKSRLCTYLLGGLAFEQVPYPLAMFQHTTASCEDTRRLLHTINKVVGEKPLPEVILNKSFDKFWPELEQEILSLPAADVQEMPARSIDDMLAEIIDFIRSERDRRKKDNFQDFCQFYTDYALTHVKNSSDLSSWGENLLNLASFAAEKRKHSKHSMLLSEPPSIDDKK